jgi:hypothetical protein
MTFLIGGDELLVILRMKVSNRIGVRNPVAIVNTNSDSGLNKECKASIIIQITYTDTGPDRKVIKPKASFFILANYW